MFKNNYTNLEIIPSDKIEQIIADKLNSAEYKEKIAIEARKFYGDIGGMNIGTIAVKRPYKKGFRPGLVFTLKEIAEYIGVCQRTIMNLQRELDIVPLRVKNNRLQKYRNYYTMYDVLKILNHYFERKTGCAKGLSPVKKGEKRARTNGCSTRKTL